MAVERLKYNSQGKIISGIRRLKRPEFGTGELWDNGDPKVNWGAWKTKYADNNGFDIRNREANGSHTIMTVLPKGTRLIRYGLETGKFTAPKGTVYDELSLPYQEESCEFNEYVVEADSITVYCNVEKGKVAPMFGASGGGIQFFHLDGTVRSLVKRNILRRV